VSRARAAVEDRRSEVAALGKDLSRRARSRCELCGEGGSLSVVEPGPAPDAPDADRALLLCGRCAALCAAPAHRPLPSDDGLRFLATAIWAELPIAQAVAVRLSRRVDAPWAREALDGLYLAPEVEALADGVEPTAEA
jgi:protein PhnA